MLRSFATAASSAGASHMKGLSPRDSEAVSFAATLTYQVVEFDGHRSDIRSQGVAYDPLGFEREFGIERVWPLALIDVCTRAARGYHVVLRREHRRYGVVKTVKKTLEPHRARTFTIDGFGSEAHGGFRSQRFPEPTYAI